MKTSVLAVTEAGASPEGASEEGRVTQVARGGVMADQWVGRQAVRSPLAQIPVRGTSSAAALPPAPMRHSEDTALRYNSVSRSSQSGRRMIGS